MTANNSPEESLRLNKYIARRLAIGRRQVDDLISRGKVLVNGERPELGARVTPADTVTVRGKKLDTESQTHTYIALNKPTGYVCSRRQQGDTPTIYAILPQQYQRLKPVGRLDKESSGLLLLTDDGDFAHRMTHPSFHKQKSYEVVLDKSLEPLHRQMISDFGVDLADGKSKLALERLTDGDDKAWRVQMHEGRNRQIRRTFAALGYTVTQLHRTTFGAYTIGTLKKGAFIPVDPA